LALEQVAEGSTDSRDARFHGATDGRIELGHWWRATKGETARWLRLDLGVRSFVWSMTLVGGDPGGFRRLRIYRSTDIEAWKGGPGYSWTFVRDDATPSHCVPGHTSRHEGWPEATRYVMIQFEDHCSGLPSGRFSLAEGEVGGFREPGMVQKYRRAWPIRCLNLWADVAAADDPHAACFSYVNLEDAKTACLANRACDGFSFSADLIDGGYGSGCYKTACRSDGGGELGFGTFGYWERRQHRWPDPEVQNRQLHGEL